MAIAINGTTEQELVIPLLKRVSESYGAMRENQLHFPQLHERIVQLENFIFSVREDALSAEEILNGIGPETLALVNQAYAFWENKIEYEFAQRIGREVGSLADYCLYERFETLIKRELALVSDSPLKHILYVGSGALPISAVLLHAQTGAFVDCVARDPAAVEVSKLAIERCGCSDAVRILGEGASDCVLQNYDLILIALGYKPKKSILRTARKRYRTGGQILCRTSEGLRQLLYESTAERDRRGFYVKAQQAAEGDQTISTLLLEAAGSAAADIRLEWLRTVDVATGKQLLRLMNRTLEEETTIGFPGPLDEETGRKLMRQLNADVQSGYRHLLVAYKDGVIVGQLILTPNSSPNHRHIVELTRGTIDPAFRGAGLVLLAFQEVARRCELLGRETICLDVRAGTNAAIWWQHFGFKQYGLLQDYSRVGDKRYQGLYLTQTTAALNERLKEIAQQR
jgi:precorrin-6B methylase 2/ribosomal protein S18 acetylase RimI-like enzyme